MRIPFRITYPDGRVVDAVAGPGAIVAFEAKFDLSFSELPTDGEGNVTGMKFAWLCFLGWKAARRVDPSTNEDFDDWLDEIEMCEALEQPLPPTSPIAAQHTAASPDLQPVSAS